MVIRERRWVCIYRRASVASEAQSPVVMVILSHRKEGGSEYKRASRRSRER